MKLLEVGLRTLILIQKMPYYAVAAGREIGIYNTWQECEQQVKGFKGPKYKKFKLKSEAEEFLRQNKNDEASLLIQTKSIICPSESKLEKESEVFSPEGFSFDDGDNGDLIAALAEVEGIPTTTMHSSLNTKKRKAHEIYKELTTKCPKLDSKIWHPIGLKKFGSYEFQIDIEGFVIVYTDGSCINNGQKDAVAGFGVYFGKNHSLNIAKPVKGRVTNNAGEIQAAIYAIQVAKDLGVTKLCLSTDSQFLINSVTLWIKAWKRRSWTLRSGQPVKNADDFKILDNLLDGSIEIKWNYVKGHEGIEGNEMADKLARQGSAMYRELHTKQKVKTL